jgi:hypothetical protein
MLNSVVRYCLGRPGILAAVQGAMWPCGKPEYNDYERYEFRKESSST